MRELKFKKTACAVCGSKSNYRIEFPARFKPSDLNPNIFQSRRNPDKLHYRMVRCNTCGLLYSNPILDSKYIQFLYSNATVPVLSNLENAAKIYLSYLDKLFPSLSKESQILDVGCGNGFFLSLLKRSGYKNIYGIEPSRDAIKFRPRNISSMRIKIGLFKNGTYPRAAFDLICFFQVFDHLVDPNYFLKNCSQNLKKGGKIFALMHNTESLSLKLMREKSPIIDVQHIYLFNKVNLKRIFEKNGFKVIDVITTYSNYSLSYWFMMGPFPKFIKNLAKKYSQTYLGKIPIKMPAGNMAIAAVKV